MNISLFTRMHTHCAYNKLKCTNDIINPLNTEIQSEWLRSQLHVSKKMSMRVFLVTKTIAIIPINRVHSMSTFQN